MIRFIRLSCFKFFLLAIIPAFIFIKCKGDNIVKSIEPGAEQTDEYLPGIINKNVGLVINHTSLTGNINLVDILLSKDIKVKVIFTPEHGFRGNFEAGDSIDNYIDIKTGIQTISLYGKNKKPSALDLKDLDVVIFDIQDVGCRFYTYISTMHYVMEACAENDIPLIVLDRPNPNGDYIDGPVLKTELKSFVGMHPIPVVHGCTVGELAQMINGEGWLNNQLKCKLKVINVKNYSHNDIYEPPVNPSPNLPNNTAIRLYPSLCFFEATNVSIGRGTSFPFQVIGFPDPSFGIFNFTPNSIKGVCSNPVQNGKSCYGIDLRNNNAKSRFTLSYFINFFKLFKDSDKFWTSKHWIDLLSGDPEFYFQINKGMNEGEIRKTWQADLEKYKLMRKKYLLYPDFE